MNRMNRRTALKGLGGITIGLPLLEEMTLAAKGKAVPVRAFNVFFGLGVPAPLQTEGFEGVLEPLKPLRDKLARHAQGGSGSLRRQRHQRPLRRRDRLVHGHASGG